MNIDWDQIQAFCDTARRFATHEVATMVGTETRDGDLAQAPNLLDRAYELGLLASAIPDSPGHEYGVWGKACFEEGPATSLAVLREIAGGCAGVATAVHMAGLGALESMGCAHPVRIASAAYFEKDFRPDPQSFKVPPAGFTTLVKTGKGLVLKGAKAFVLAPKNCDGFVVYAKDDNGWQRVLVPRTAEGPGMTDAENRTGLAAVSCVHLDFADMRISTDRILAPAPPKDFIGRLMLGLCAIALGNADGALATARSYAAERYQGGAEIEIHPAVQILLGDSAARVEACASHLTALSMEKKIDLDRCLAARLRITLECFQAVTDCLQVLGGYGYMEDYRQEKRLRDAMTLKSMVPRPDDLRMLLGMPKGGGK